MVAHPRFGVVVDVDDLVRIGTPRRQWRRLRGLLQRSTRDLRSPFFMSQLVRALATQTAAPVYYVSALPNAFDRRVRRFLEHDGFPPGRLLTAPGSRRLWRVIAGGRADKRAALDRLLADRSVERWLLIGDDGGHSPEVFTDVVGGAPGRVAAVGLRQTFAPARKRAGAPDDQLHGVPVVFAPNGEELLPLLRAAAGLPTPRADGPGDWLLGADERGNDATRLRAWTEGNDARQLVHGATYFPALATTLDGAGPGDMVLLGGWRCDHDQRLDGPGPTVALALGDAARRGVLVRGLLWRSHPSALGYHLEPNRQTALSLAPAGGQVLLDQRVRPLGCHHQKFVVVRHPRRPADDVAFVGGIDLDRGSRDDAGHAGDPQPSATTTRTYYGPNPARHDVQVQLQGPVVQEIDELFRERWRDRAALTRLPWQTLHDRVRRVPRTAPPLPAAPPAPPPSGTCTVQVLRTYPARRPPSPFAPRGERSIARAYAKALDRAQRLIYLEDQYLWSVDVARLFAAALRRAPHLQLIAVVPRYPDVEGHAYLEMARSGHGEALAMVHEAGGDRVQILNLENHEGRPVYVHAKLTVIDDVWAAVGSANLNLRSWTHDSELSVAILDEQRDPRAPADPGGLGDGARRFARELRLELLREHLDLDGRTIGVSAATDDLLLDPERAARTVRERAAELDAWHAGGRRGPRPPGRLRRHGLHPAGRLPAWTRWVAAPAYRAFLDPDGRPLGMRLRRSY